MKIFEFIINPEDEELGMKAISLVDKPAIESEYIAFNKQEKPKFIQFQDDKKYIVAGLALIPDKLIYRVDEETGEDYLGYFSAETIEMIMDKFMKESTNGTLQNVNLQHNADNKVQAHLVESFILRTPEMVAAVKAMGIEEAVEGAWFVSYKFEDKEAYDAAVSGGQFTGFSIEIMLQRELKMHKNNKINNDKFMTKVKNFIDKFKNILAEMEDVDVTPEGETKLAEGKIADTDIVLRWGEIGMPVLKVAIAEDGTETTEALPEGEYVLENGDVLVVDAMGNLLELKPKAEAPAPLPEEDMAEEKPEVPAEEVKQEVAPEIPAEEKPAEIADVSAKTLGEIVDVSKDGEYKIKVTVVGGQITAATVEAAQDLISKADFEALQTENAELKERIESIKIKPLFNEFTKFNDYSDDKEDKKTLNNLEYHLKKLGLNK